MLVQLKNIFSAQNIAGSLSLLPDIQTTVMDDFFKQRPTHPSPMIGMDVITSTIGTLPVTSRDGQPTPIASEAHDMQFIAPLPIKPSITVSASELNDLKALMGSVYSIENWRNQKVDQLRRAVRDTTEAMSSVVLSQGKVAWPRQLSNGTTTYTIDYGSPLSYTPTAKLTGSSKVSELWKLLKAMKTAINRKGVGGRIEFRAGEDVFAVIIDILENRTSTTDAKTISVSLDEGVAKVGGYVIKELSESYPSPIDGTWVPKLDPKTLMAIATEVPGTIWYCAIDSISANNAAVPFHVVPEVQSGDSAILLIAQSKPLPARNPNTVCSAVVVN